MSGISCGQSGCFEAPKMRDCGPGGGGPPEGAESESIVRPRTREIPTSVSAPVDLPCIHNACRTTLVAFTSSQQCRPLLSGAELLTTLKGFGLQYLVPSRSSRTYALGSSATFSRTVYRSPSRLQRHQAPSRRIMSTSGLKTMAVLNGPTVYVELLQEGRQWLE